MNLHAPSPDLRMPLGEKLRRVNQHALGLAVGLLALVITLGSLVISALALESNSRVMARVLADNAAASLMFLDNDAAARVLATLERLPDVRGAAIFDTQQAEFARYGQFHAEGRESPSLSAEHAHFGLGTLHLTQPIVENGNVVGVLDLDLDMKPLYTQVLAHTSISARAAVREAASPCATSSWSTRSRPCRSAGPLPCAAGRGLPWRAWKEFMLMV